MPDQKQLLPLMPFASSTNDVASRVSDLMEKWSTPEGRQEIISGLAAMGGGTAAAMLTGGLLSIPVGGLSAAAAERIAEALGPSVGAAGAPERTAGEEVMEFGKDAALEMGADVVGRGVFRAAQPETWRNLLKKPFTPRDSLNIAGADTPRSALSQIADDKGIEMTLAARSGRRTPQMLESILSIHPASVDTIHGAIKKSVDDISDKGLRQGIASKIHPEAVAPDDIAEAAVEKLTGKQRALKSTMDLLMGRPPSRAAAGEAYQKARSGALDDFSALGRKLYDENPVLEPHWDSPVDMTQAGLSAREAIEKNLSPDEIRNLLPAAATRTMGSIGALRPVEKVTGPNGISMEDVAKGFGVSASELPPGLLQRMGFEAETEAPTMTLRQLKELRTALMERFRGMGDNSPAGARVALAQAIDSLNNAVRGSDLPEEAVNEWFRVGNVYRENASRLFPPSASRSSRGNPMATVGERKEPEKVIDAIVKEGSDTGDRGIRDAMAAAGHRPELDKFAEGVIGEKYAAQSRRDLPLMPMESMISPRMLTQRREAMGPGVEDALFHRRGKPTPELLSRGASRGLLRAEHEAVDSPRAQAITKFAKSEKSAQDLLRSGLAPAKNPAKFEKSVGFMGDEGGKKLRRAFFDDALDRATKRDNQLSIERVVSPPALEGMLKESPQAFDIAVGPDQARNLREMSALGMMAKETEILRGNTSRTTPAGALLHMGRSLVEAIPKSMRMASAAGSGALLFGPAIGPIAGAAANVAVPMAAAKAYTNPKAAKFLTSAPEAVTPGGVGAGTFGRGAFNLPFITDNGPQEQAQTPPPSEGRQRLRDILGY